MDMTIHINGRNDCATVTIESNKRVKTIRIHTEQGDEDITFLTVNEGACKLAALRLAGRLYHDCEDRAVMENVHSALKVVVAAAVLP